MPPKTNLYPKKTFVMGIEVNFVNAGATQIPEQAHEKRKAFEAAYSLILEEEKNTVYERCEIPIPLTLDR